MKGIKKNDRFVDIETGAEWIFDCKTRAPDMSNGPGVKPTMSWTYVFFNRAGERRFIHEQRMDATFRTDDAAVSGG